MILTGYSSDGLMPYTKSDKAFKKCKCCYCNVNLTRANYTREHIIPKHKGGNITRPCCYKCNQEKGGMMLEYYISLLTYNLANMDLINYPINSKVYKIIKTKLKNAKKLLGLV